MQGRMMMYKVDQVSLDELRCARTFRENVVASLG